MTQTHKIQCVGAGCTVHFGDVVEWQDHYVDRHVQLICSGCTMTLASVDDHQAHLLNTDFHTHSKDEEVECCDCGVHLYKLSSWKEHQKQQHIEICQPCNSGFVGHKHYHAHMMTADHQNLFRGALGLETDSSLLNLSIEDPVVPENGDDPLAIGMCTKRVSQLEKEVAILERRNQAAKDELGVLSHRLIVASEDYQLLKDKKMSFEVENTELKAKLNRLTVDRMELGEELAMKNADLFQAKNLKYEMDKLQEAFTTQLLQAAQEVTRVTEEKNQHISNLKVRIKTVEADRIAEIVALKNMVAIMDAEIRKLREELAKLPRRTSSVIKTSKSQDTEAELKRATEMLKDLTVSNQALKELHATALAAKDREIQEIRANNQRLLARKIEETARAASESSNSPSPPNFKFSKNHVPSDAPIDGSEYQAQLAKAKALQKAYEETQEKEKITKPQKFQTPQKATILKFNDQTRYSGCIPYTRSQVDPANRKALGPKSPDALSEEKLSQRGDGLAKLLANMGVKPKALAQGPAEAEARSSTLVAKMNRETSKASLVNATLSKEKSKITINVIEMNPATGEMVEVSHDVGSDSDTSLGEINIFEKVKKAVILKEENREGTYNALNDEAVGTVASPKEKAKLTITVKQIDPVTDKMLEVTHDLRSNSHSSA